LTTIWAFLNSSKIERSTATSEGFMMGLVLRSKCVA
jgi:hypothetical protein